MRIPGTACAHLTYCLNVHAGETWRENVDAIRTHAVGVRDAVARDGPFGLGLRVSDLASRELASPQALAAFRKLLEQRDLYVFTINGFPYGPFHAVPVKENVYLPDWRMPERVDYTIRLADILADLLPDGTAGSISTVPCSYKSWIQTAQDIEQMTRNLAGVIAHLVRLRERTGREIHVGLEPEPDCFLESTPETIDWYDRVFLPHAVDVLRESLGTSRREAEAAARRHLGVCFDTCHLALQFEDLAESVNALGRHGIRISKVQVSSALRVDSPTAARPALERFCDSVYLHQVKTRAGRRVESRGDLSDALSAPDTPAGEPWRIHCHVPLYYDGAGELSSTAGDITPAFLCASIAAGVSHFEIETYTFDVLPPEAREPDLVHSIAREFEWVLGRFAAGPV